MDEFLKSLGFTGLKYEDLTKVEKDTLLKWKSSIQSSALSIPNIREGLAEMRNAIAMELATTGLNVEQDTFLKARLKNIMLFEAFLSSPDRAQNEIKRALASYQVKV